MSKRRLLLKTNQVESEPNFIDQTIETSGQLNDLAINSDANLITFTGMNVTITGIAGGTENRVIHIFNRTGSSIRIAGLYEALAGSSSPGNKFLFGFNGYGISSLSIVSFIYKQGYWFILDVHGSALNLNISNVQLNCFGATYTFSSTSSFFREMDGSKRLIISITNINSSGTPTGQFSITFNADDTSYRLPGAGMLIRLHGSNASNIENLVPIMNSGGSLILINRATGATLSGLTFTSGRIEILINM